MFFDWGNVLPRSHGILSLVEEIFYPEIMAHKVWLRKFSTRNHGTLSLFLCFWMFFCWVQDISQRKHVHIGIFFWRGEWVDKKAEMMKRDSMELVRLLLTQ